MKRCPKTQPEPAILKAYRTANPASNWDQMKNEDPGCYNALRKALYRDQGGLCSYCEINLESKNTQIAHFHPKSDTSGQHSWAFDWDNLWLSCKGGSQTWMQNEDCYCSPLPENLSCDEKKGERVLEGQVFTPLEIPAFPRIFRYEQQPDRIEIHPDEKLCASAGVPVNKAQRTIDEFNLNCIRLASARLALHRNLEKAVKRLRESNINPQDGLRRLVSQHMKKGADGCWQRFLTLVRWRFGNYAEEYLQSIDYQG